MNTYSNILYLSRPVSGRRAKMSLSDRAAQFSPFAALTGFDGVIAETGRLTDRSLCLDEGAITELNEQLNLLQTCIHTRPEVIVTYFQPDDRKDGGRYVTKTGTAKQLDTTFQKLVFTDRTEIPFDRLLAVRLTK
jgi:hypothetical protein